MALSSAHHQPEPSKKPLDAFRARPDIVAKLGRDACTGLETGIARFAPDDSNCDKGMQLYLALKQTIGVSLLDDGFKRGIKHNHFRLTAPPRFSPFSMDICFTRGNVEGDLVDFNRKGVMFVSFIKGNGQLVLQGELDLGLPPATTHSRLLMVVDVREDMVAPQGYSGSIYLVDGKFATDSGEFIAIQDSLVLSHFPDLGDFSGGFYEAPELG